MFPPSDSTSGVRKFLSWTQQMRAQYGDSPDIRILAETASHEFTLLPYHPSIRDRLIQDEDPIATIEERARQLVTKDRHVAAECIEKVSTMVQRFARELAEDLEENPDKIYEAVLKSLRDRCREVREQYEQTVQQFTSKFQAEKSEFRLTSPTALPHLRDSEEEFRFGVVDLLRQPEPM